MAGGIDSRDPTLGASMLQGLGSSGNRSTPTFLASSPDVLGPGSVPSNAGNVLFDSNYTLITESSDINISNMTDVQDILYTQKLWGKHIGMIIICIFALVGNGLLVLTIARHKHLWTNTNAFITSLATADLLFAFPTVPLHILAESTDNDEVLGYSISTMCLVAMSLTSFQIVISVTTMLALTVERYVSIVRPLKHRKWAQLRWVRITIAIIWIYSAIFGALPLMGWNALHYYNPWVEACNGTGGMVPRCSFLIIHTGQYMGILFMLHIFPACLIIPILYIHMFCTIQRFVQRNRSLRQSHSNGGNDPPTTHHLSSRRSLRLLVVMIIYFVFSWLPVLVWYFIATNGFTHTHMTIKIIENISIPSTYYQVAVNLGFANSAVNPYIYGLGNMNIRRTLVRMCRQDETLHIARSSKQTLRSSQRFSPCYNGYAVTNGEIEDITDMNILTSYRMNTILNH